MTEARAQKLLVELTLHYGERVATASSHCSALMEWMRVMGESGYAPQVPEAWGTVSLTLVKSNLAARLVYGGENVRTEPCPIHKGHWMGCVWGDQACPEGCMWGSNVTGWLPEPHDFEEWERSAEQQEAFPMDSVRCRHCGGTKEAGVHNGAEGAPRPERTA